MRRTMSQPALARTSEPPCLSRSSLSCVFPDRGSEVDSNGDGGGEDDDEAEEEEEPIAFSLFVRRTSAQQNAEGGWIPPNARLPATPVFYRRSVVISPASVTCYDIAAFRKTWKTAVESSLSPCFKSEFGSLFDAAAPQALAATTLRRMPDKTLSSDDFTLLFGAMALHDLSCPEIEQRVLDRIAFPQFLTLIQALVDRGAHRAVAIAYGNRMMLDHAAPSLLHLCAVKGVSFDLLHYFCARTSASATATASAAAAVFQPDDEQAVHLLEPYLRIPYAARTSAYPVNLSSCIAGILRSLVSVQPPHRRRVFRQFGTSDIYPLLYSEAGLRFVADHHRVIPSIGVAIDMCAQHKWTLALRVLQVWKHTEQCTHTAPSAIVSGQTEESQLESGPTADFNQTTALHPRLVDDRGTSVGDVYAAAIAISSRCDIELSGSSDLSIIGTFPRVVSAIVERGGTVRVTPNPSCFRREDVPYIPLAQGAGENATEERDCLRSRHYKMAYESAAFSVFDAVDVTIRDIVLPRLLERFQYVDGIAGHVVSYLSLFDDVFRLHANDPALRYKVRPATALIKVGRRARAFAHPSNSLGKSGTPKTEVLHAAVVTHVQTQRALLARLFPRGCPLPLPRLSLFADPLPLS